MDLSKLLSQIQTTLQGMVTGTPGCAYWLIKRQGNLHTEDQQRSAANLTTASFLIIAITNRPHYELLEIDEFIRSVYYAAEHQVGWLVLSLAASDYGYPSPVLNGHLRFSAGRTSTEVSEGGRPTLSTRMQCISHPGPHHHSHEDRNRWQSDLGRDHHSA